MFSHEPPGRSGGNRGYSGRSHSSSSGDWDYRKRDLDPQKGRDAELRQLAEKDLESAIKLAKSRGMDLATIVDVSALAKRQAAREAAAKKRQQAQRAAEIADKGKETCAKLDRAAKRAEMARYALETDIEKHPLYLLRRGATDITLSLNDLQSIASEVSEHEGIRDEIFFATSLFVRAAKGFLDCTTHHKLKDKRLGELAEQINAFMRKMVKVGWDESSYSSSDHRSGDKHPQQADHTIVSGNGTRFRNLLATVPVEHSRSTQQRSPAVQRSRALASRTIQRSSKNATKTAPTTNSTIDPPQPAINKPGFIDNDDGSNIRTGPAELDGQALTAQPLPPATRVFVSGQHPEAPTWWYVSAHRPEAIVRGYVQNFRVNTDLPEPSAKLYQIKSGDTARALARREFSASVRDGHDLRYYENVLLAVNRDKNRAGVKGTFQDPGIVSALWGGGDNNIQLEAGRRIWLVSPAYARSLEGMVPDGSLTNGRYAKVKRVLGHIDDLVQSVTDSPQYFGTVAGEYAEAIKDHLPEIIGITAGFILAESASAFLAATPTGVGQLAAVVIQLGLAAFGASFAIDAGIEALKHGEQWLTLAWTAKGDPSLLTEASKEFLKMLVSIATAALAILGVRGNVGKGLKIADAIKIQPPKVGWSPAMVTPEGAVVPSGPVFTPGTIATSGPVDIGISAMTGVSSGGSRVKPESKEKRRTDNENSGKSGEDTAKGDSVEQAGSTRTVVNSGGNEVVRRTVPGHDELLAAAERAAGGSLDKLKEFKPGWWEGIRPDGTRVKIEWETVGHTTTNEGPHVTVRVWDPSKGKKGGWRVTEKHFIDGQETLR